jgi:hypothetical protein
VRRRQPPDEPLEQPKENTTYSCDNVGTVTLVSHCAGEDITLVPERQAVVEVDRNPFLMSTAM